MADEWYFMKNGRKMGPLSSKTIVDLAASGKLLPTDSIQKKGTTTWQDASAVKGLFTKAAAPVSTTPVIAIPDDADESDELPPDATPDRDHSAAASHPEIRSPKSAHTDAAPSDRKYKYLDWYIASSRTIARIIFALIAITGLYPLLIAALEVMLGGKSETILTALLVTLFTFPLATLFGYLFFMVQMASADFLSAVRDIEENTRSRTK